MTVRDPWALETVGTNEFNINPLHDEPVLVQIARAVDRLDLCYNMILAPINTGPAVMHNLVLSPYIRDVIATITPMSLRNITDHLWRDPQMGAWIPIIDRPTMKILFWNLRGSIRNDTMRQVRDYVDEYNPFMIVLMDTRADLLSSVGPMGCLGFDKYHIVTPTVDHPNMGGFWFLWDGTRVAVEVDRTTDRVAHFKIRFLALNHAVQMSSVYNYAQHAR